jgi:hypothetical protein
MVLVVVRSPCGNCGAPAADPVQVGWIDPTTGVFTPGAPPADAGPCETPTTTCVETICRQRCDDTTGDGTADTTYTELWCLAADGSATLLLTYQDDPSTPYTPVSPVDCTYGCPESETVMLCDATGPFLRRYSFLAGTATYEDVALDGNTPHVVIGTPGACAGDGTGGGTPCGTTALLPLCDTALDGTVTRFVRRLTFDCAGAIIDSDDTLDGSTPYAITGTIGQCAAEAEPCRDTSTLLLCDLPTDGTPTATVTDTPGAPYYPYTTGVATAGAQTLWDGGALTLPAAAGPQPGTGGTVRTAAAILQAPRPVCDAGTAHVTVQVDVTQLGPDNGCRVTGFLGLYNGPGDANRVALALAPPDTPAGWAGTLTAEADVPAADLAAGNIAVLVAFDAYDDSGATCPPPRSTGWQLANFAATVAYDQTGCATQFLRNVTTDCETGAVTAVTDTTLDGTPYTVTGEPGQCTASGAGSCCPQPPCPAQSVLEQCRCDDQDGDGIPETGYVELLAVDCTGTVTSVGTYLPDYSAPYTPVAPMDCDAGDDLGAPPAYGVQAHRVELTGSGTWTADAWPTLQSVTAVAHGGTGTITTADGPSTLHQGEAATWSIARDEDARLTGPLAIAADTGTVTVTFTTGVQL